MSRQTLTAADLPAGTLTQTAADARYPQKTDVDPYPTYQTQAESDARYSQTGHNHDGSYYTEAEADAKYSVTSHNHDAAYVNAAGGDTVTGTLTLSAPPVIGATAQPKITVAASAPSSPATGDLWIW